MISAIIPAPRRRRCYDAARPARGPQMPELQPSASFRHCPRCGHGPGVPVENALLSCPACGFHFHFNPAAAAGVLVQDEAGRLLLLRRAHEPARGAFGFPGGFADAGESIEHTIRRETLEETGLEVEDDRVPRRLAEPLRVARPRVPRARPLLHGARPEGLAGVGRDTRSTSASGPVPRRSTPRRSPSPRRAPPLRATASARAAPPAGSAAAPARAAGRALHVVLVEPEIHWNTGNAGRTCLAAGAQLHLVEPLGFSLDEREVRRAGLDYWQRVAPRVWPGWQALEAALPELGEPYFASPDAPRELWQVRYPEQTVLVFGRESVGLPRRDPRPLPRPPACACRCTTRACARSTSRPASGSWSSRCCGSGRAPADRAQLRGSATPCRPSGSRATRIFWRRSSIVKGLARKPRAPSRVSNSAPSSSL